MNRIIFNPKLILLMVVAFVFTASSLMAQPKIRGNVGYAFGTYSKTNEPGDDIEGFTFSLENNLFFEGKVGDMDYRIRLRMRGIDRPEAAGDTNTVNDQELQTVRGWARWNVSPTFNIRITNMGTGPVAHVSENDPVQNLACAGCRIGEISDEPQIDFTFKNGGNQFGFYLSNEAPSGLHTTGNDGDSQKTGGSNALTTGVFGNLKFDGINLLIFFITSSADNDNNNDGKFDDFAGGATAFMVAVKAKVGDIKIAADFESGTSDLAVGEDEVDHIGVKISVAGLNAAIGVGTQLNGATKVEKEQQIIAVHYRIPVGKGAWIGPEFQQRTDSSDAVGSVDVTTQTLRFLMVAKF